MERAVNAINRLNFHPAGATAAPRLVATAISRYRGGKRRAKCEEQKKSKFPGHVRPRSILCQ